MNTLLSETPKQDAWNAARLATEATETSTTIAQVEGGWAVIGADGTVTVFTNDRKVLLKHD